MDRQNNQWFIVNKKAFKDNAKLTLFEKSYKNNNDNENNLLTNSLKKVLHSKESQPCRFRITLIITLINIVGKKYQELFLWCLF